MVCSDSRALVYLSCQEWQISCHLLLQEDGQDRRVCCPRLRSAEYSPNGINKSVDRDATNIHQL